MNAHNLFQFPNLHVHFHAMKTHSLTIKLNSVRSKRRMEALWNLEDKYKLSTQRALVLLVCAALGVCVGVLCTVTMLLRNKTKREKLVSLQQEANEYEVDKMVGREPSGPKCGWDSIKRALTGSGRWSKARKWEEIEGGSRRETPSSSSEVRLKWPSHNSDSPVWQRPILMGEKCELPSFSGLILYDQKGQPLCDDDAHGNQTSCKLNTNQVIINLISICF